VTRTDPTLQRAPHEPHNGVPPVLASREDPGALGPLRPVVDRWPLVLLVVVLFVGGAVYAGLARTPTHRAEAQINIGRTDVRVQALPGYVAGAATLANAYSRVVESDEIVDRVARRLDRVPAGVAADLTAVPVPENPILRIIGRDADADAAVRLTATAATELRRYVARTDESIKSFDAMLSDFRAQSRRAADLRRQINRLSSRSAAADLPGATAAAPSAKEEAQLRVAYDTARLRADSLGQMYRERQSELSSTAGIEVISRAAITGDDRRSVLQRLIAIGLVGGVVVGSALAMLLGARRRRHPA
jgi:uncharacterized protein involved in exopolysaccharide biosynthesis